MKAELKRVEADDAASTEGHWEVQVLDGDKLAVLPRYDSQSGEEWIYVVKESLSDTNAGSYEQVFGTVTWNETKSEWTKTLDDLSEWGLSERASGNTYLYNGDTLTNLQTGTISVGATKEWKSATFQSGFDEVVVELTLQVREKNSQDPWKDYTDADGKPMVRYLFDFTPVNLTDTLDALPALNQYLGGDKTKELEYRWIETAVYGGVANAETREAVEKAIAAYNQNPDGNIRKYEINYNTGENGADTSTSDNPTGTFSNILGESRSYTVSYEVDSSKTNITNAVQDSVDYEVIKEWYDGSTQKEITLQIFRTVTGEEFNYKTPYLEFTLDEGNAALTTEGSASTEEKKKITVEKKENFDDYTALTGSNQASWLALVSGLPAFDAEGRTYEYILLEKAESGIPVYENVKTDTADYRTIIANGKGTGGFNLLVRKIWLDNSDVLHRDPVTFTLYNKNTEQPVKKTDGSNYTLTLGKDIPNVWSSVFWIGLGEIEQDTNNQIATAQDVYLVETAVGEDSGGTLYDVDHHLGAGITYGALYGGNGQPGGVGDANHIFDVTTGNHRYQVTYKAEYEPASDLSGEFPDGVGGGLHRHQPPSGQHQPESDQDLGGRPHHAGRGWNNGKQHDPLGRDQGGVGEDWKSTERQKARLGLPAGV